MISPLTWVHPDAALPPPENALKDPPGLVAAGADLTTERLIEAYRQGIFPWFSEGDPVLWWSPDPRMVLMTDELHVSKSLKKQLAQIERAQSNGRFGVIVTTDLAFDLVMQGCASRGKSTRESKDTWITADMYQAYHRWHEYGDVHSIETWVDGELAGGLYGVCLGRMFFGESMFTRLPNASKLALVHLVRFLSRQGVRMIDCQMETAHLASLGARPIDRADFLTHVRTAVTQRGFEWSVGWIDGSGTCHPEMPNTVKLKVNAKS